MDRLLPPASGEKMAKLLYSLKFLYLKLGTNIKGAVELEVLDIFDMKIFM